MKILNSLIFIVEKNDRASINSLFCPTCDFALCRTRKEHEIKIPQHDHVSSDFDFILRD